MEQSEGFTLGGKEDWVCPLKQCIYGLKQAPRVWNAKLNQFLLKYGLVKFESFPCVYHHRKGNELLIVNSLFNDGLVAGYSIWLLFRV